MEEFFNELSFEAQEKKMTQKEINNLDIIKRYMLSRDNLEYIETLDKVIEYVKRTNQ